MKRPSFFTTLAIVALTSLTALMLGCDSPANNATNNKPVVSSPTPDPCGSTTDAMIVGAIYGEMKKQGLTGQIKHMNVISKQRNVSFNGWADSKIIKDQIINIAKGVSCVGTVNDSSLGEQLPKDPNGQDRPLPAGGCASGYKPCREFCIPEAEACTVASDPADPGNVNTNSNPRSPAKSNTNLGANANGNKK